MPDAAKQYEKLVHEYRADARVVAGQMFGKPCMKVNGKAFIAQHGDTVVFKLGGNAHAKAISQAGAVLWDPSGKGRPMKEWVALPVAAARSFKSLAASACEAVAAAT